MQGTEYEPLAEVKDGKITDFEEGVCHNELWSISNLIKKKTTTRKHPKYILPISIVLRGFCFDASAQHYANGNQFKCCILRKIGTA